MPYGLDGHFLEVPHIGLPYRIQYRIGNQRRLREAVMPFIGFRFGVSSYEEWAFNARPIAGTQTLPVSCISSIELVSAPYEVYLNKII